MRCGRVYLTTAMLVGTLVLVDAPPAAAAPCAPPVSSPVACENTKPGTPASVWDLGNGNGGDPSIQGFATDASVDQGTTVRFKVDTDASAWRVNIYRLGFYGGAGARLITTVNPSVAQPQNQPGCLQSSSTGLVDCGNWAVSASWAVPSDAVSGIYLAQLVRTDTGGRSDIVFIVRDDDGASDIVVQASDTTWQAYNHYGGNSLYQGQPAGRAYKVSFNRPLIFRGHPQYGFGNFFAEEYPMLRWLEANGYDVSYISGVDSERAGASLRQHSVFLSSGHDEYWSAGQRANVEAALDAGVDLAFFSGNEVFWKTRWEPAIDGSGTPHRTLVSYKETAAGQPIDPADPPTWTGTWRDPRFSPPADGGRPENALTGTMFMVNCCGDSGAIEVPAAEGALRFWRGTSVASLAPGQKATLAAGSLGYEWDEDIDNGFRPPGLVHLSSTTKQVNQRLVDHGTTYAPGTATHHLTLYRASSGALAFGAGTIRWAWGLDGYHDAGPSTPDVRMQQATVNLLADMGVQPSTLQPGLVAASQTTDSVAPTVSITSPATGAAVPVGSTVNIMGTAADASGRVGAVEVSTDGGSSWHPATGRESWSYSWTAGASGTPTIQARASDDSANVSAPVSRTVTVGSGQPGTCPCTLFGSTAPVVLDSGDAPPVEVGVRFRSDVDGVVTHLRFFKGGSFNGGTHVGSLWSSTGVLLGRATFTGETASGWQQVALATPVAVTAGTTYVASYFAPQGRYSYTLQQFADGESVPPLHALPPPNGVYRYASAPTFPIDSLPNANATYGVDLVFTPGTAPPPPPDTTAPTVVEQTPVAGATGWPVGSPTRARFSEPVTASTVAMSLRTLPGGTAVAGATSYDGATQTATFTPTSALAANTSYEVTVSGAQDGAGNTMTSVSWSFTTAAAAGTCPCTLFGSTAPVVLDSGDAPPVEVGVRFRSDVDGVVTHLRFFKGGSFNGGTHVGSLWSSTGVLLGRATFTGETASGWQQVALATPVAVTAGTTYVASYFAPQGRYSYTLQQFADGESVPPLHALPPPNGVYRYASAPTFPIDSLPNANATYGVDLVFTPGTAPPPPPDTTAPTVVEQTPVAGATGWPVGSPPRARFSEPVTASTVAMSLRTVPGGTAVAGATSYDGATQTATFTPTSALAANTSYEVTVSGAQDGAGNTMTSVSWSFTTAAAAGTCPCTLFGSTAPVVLDSGDAPPVEVGVRFRSDVDGVVTHLRFFKGGSFNGGTHVGSLWSSTGTLLGRATFTGESGSGWQQVALATPVAVTAGTTYVASYFAPQGRYSYTLQQFADGESVPPLHALPPPNGVYRYSLGADVPDRLVARTPTPPTASTSSSRPGASPPPSASDRAVSGDGDAGHLRPRPHRLVRRHGHQQRPERHHGHHGRHRRAPHGAHLRVVQRLRLDLLGQRGHRHVQPGDVARVGRLERGHDQRERGRQRPRLGQQHRLDQRGPRRPRDHQQPGHHQRPHSRGPGRPDRHVHHLGPPPGSERDDRPHRAQRRAAGGGRHGPRHDHTRPGRHLRVDLGERLDVQPVGLHHHLQPHDGARRRCIRPGHHRHDPAVAHRPQLHDDDGRHLQPHPGSRSG